MIQLRTNGAPTEEVSIALVQDGREVDIRVNGQIVGFFQVQDGKVTLELVGDLNMSEELSGKLNLTDDGFLVART